MVRFRPFMIGVLGCLLAAGTPLLYGASSSAVVVESRSNDDAQQETRRQPRELPFRPPVEEEPGVTGSGGETQYQIQLLQQEVQQLRGQIEKLEHEMSVMRATQEDRYLELDGRFQNLMQQLEGGRSTATMDIELDEESGQTAPRSVSGNAKTSGDEQQMYESALEMIRNREYDGAIAQLKMTIDQHPDGEYTANAYYWLGEVYAAKPEPEYENARQALAQVITYFPEHRKVPDAAFKLGKVYHLMGDCERAADILNQVVDQQKGRSVAKLAESYLRDKVGDCNQ